jgi:DNA-binding ferritin-like protein
MSEKSALPSHSTEVNTTAAWDNGTNERRVKSPATRDYFRRIYAWLDNGADDTRKSSYRFIHHMVAADGTPGAANFRALAAGVAALNGSRRGTILDDAGRRGVYRHLAAHYDDAGRQAPPLLAKSEIDEIFSSIERKSNDLFIGSQIRVEDEDGILLGTVVSVKDGVAEVREWIQEDEQWLPTDSIHDILVSSVKLGTFLSDPDDDDDDDDEVSTLPYCVDEKNLSNILSSELKDGEMTEQDFEVLVKSIAKLVIAEIGVNVTAEEKADMMPMMEMPEADAAADAQEVAMMPNLVDALGNTLSNVVEFYFSAHRAHWNVQGADFTEYHQLFEEIYGDVYESIDPLAENMRKLGGFPPSLSSMVGMAMVKDNSSTTDAAALANDLVAKNEALIAMYKAVFEIAEENDEQGVANFLAERIDMHEKWRWQLTASLSATTQGMKSDEVVEEVKEAEEAEVKEAAECCAEDCKHDECECCKDKEEAAEEAAAEAEADAEAAEEEAPAEDAKSDQLTLEDLKEFSELVKML